MQPAPLRPLLRKGGTVIVLLSMLVNLSPTIAAFEMDAVDTVMGIVDGDTFDTSLNGRIRLADVDAPESYEQGYAEASEALTAMIGGKTVHLDVDDVSRTDPYDRLVCVVYVRHNSTHLLNVNRALVDQGRAVITDFSNNEFDPGTWTAYVYSPEKRGGFPTDVLVVFVAAVAVLAAVGGLFIIRRQSRKPHN